MTLSLFPWPAVGRSSGLKGGDTAAQEAKERRAPAGHLLQVVWGGGGTTAPPPRVCAGQEVVRPGGEQFEGPLVFTPEAVAISSLGRSVGPFLVSPRPPQHSLEEAGRKGRDLFPGTRAGLGGSDSAPGGGWTHFSPGPGGGMAGKGALGTRGGVYLHSGTVVGGDWLPEQEGEGQKLLTSAGGGSCEACPASPTYHRQVIAMRAFQGESHT